MFHIHSATIGRGEPWAPAGPAPTISTDSCSKPRLSASKGSARGPGRRHGAAPVEGATKLGKQLRPGELAKHGLFYGILWETPLKHDGTSWGLILQGGAPKIAKLVYNSNNYGLWYLQLYLLGFINQLITGGHHPVGNDKINMMIDSDLWLFSWETRWKHGDRP